MGKGKKNKKKSTNEDPPHPGTSTGGFVVPRTDFHSRNLGTGRPTIQCIACGEYPHWRRECPYDNFCTTCNNHDHVTHMCRAPKQTTQQSPAICVYCGSTDHSSSRYCNRPWDNREQPCSTPEALRNQEFQHPNSKISGNSSSHHPNNHSNSYFSRENRPIMTVTTEGTLQQVLADNPLEEANTIITLINLILISEIMGTTSREEYKNFYKSRPLMKFSKFNNSEIL